MSASTISTCKNLEFLKTSGSWVHCQATLSSTTPIRSSLYCLNLATYFAAIKQQTEQSNMPREVVIQSGRPRQDAINYITDNGKNTLVVQSFLNAARPSGEDAMPVHIAMVSDYLFNVTISPSKDMICSERAVHREPSSILTREFFF